MKRIRCGRGLGDSLYLQAVVRHLKQQGQALTVCSDFPDVFRPLDVPVIPFTRDKVDIVAHYTVRKRLDGTDQFQDCCIQAGIKEPVDFRLDWVRTSDILTDQVLASGKPVVCVQLPRAPMARTDGFGAELLPRCSAIQAAIDTLQGRAFVVQLGSGTPLHRFTGIDLDLSNRTTICELLDVASVATSFIGYCSFFVPLAESLNKPALFVWSKRGLRSVDPFINRIKPQKILHRQASRWVLDDAKPDQIQEAVNAIL